MCMGIIALYARVGETAQSGIICYEMRSSSFVIVLVLIPSSNVQVYYNQDHLEGLLKKVVLPGIQMKIEDQQTYICQDGEEGFQLL